VAGFLCLNVIVVGGTNSGKPLPGIAAIAITFWAASAYLGVVGLVMLESPGRLSMALGAPLLNGLELAGPYMFLLVAAAGGLIGWGLWRRNSWARRIAILAGLVGLVFTLPGLSIEVMNFRWSLIWPGLGVLVRMLMVWYLYQAPVTEWFAGKQS
jgi:hypothetical protein